jgi:hypothetical protein
MPAAAPPATFALLDRLRRRNGAPLVLGGSPLELLGAHPGEPPAEVLPRILRHSPERLVEVQRAIADAGADLLVAPTAGTSAAGLRTTGFAYRAAALTGAAVELTRDAALASRRRAALVGELDLLDGDARAGAEGRTHVERLAVANVDAVLILADDLGRAAAIAEIARASRIGAIVEIAVEALTGRAGAASAATACGCVVVRGIDPEAIGAAIKRLRRECPEVRFGARLMATSDAIATQLAAQAAWGVLAPLGLALLGAVGAQALAGQRALVELAHDA